MKKVYRDKRAVLRRWPEFNDPRFLRFIACLLNDRPKTEVAERLRRERVNLYRVFRELKVYINVEGRSVAPGRRKRAKQDRTVFNRGVRQHGVSPGVGRWLIARSELARSTRGLGRVHNIDALAGVHIYLELKTGRRVSMGELAYLVEATNYAFRRKPDFVDPNTLTQELLRHRRGHSNFLKLLKADIAKQL